MAIVGVSVLVVLVVGAVAIAAAGGGGGGSASSPTASPSPQPPAAASDLHASAGAFRVKLTWTAGTDGAPAVRYDIQRDTEIVGHTDRTSWVDTHVTPGQRYAYQVIALGPDGLRSSTAVRTTTKTAPPGTANLEGVFNVKLHPTSHYGLSSFRDKDTTAGWRFVPACKQPPCDTKMNDLHWKALTLTLDQTGGRYHGSTSISGVVSCSGHGVSATYTLTITATKADAVKEGWRITAFTGELTQYASAQLGCVSSSVRYGVQGTLVASSGR
ncbi:MAG TPA: hypothetical protein VFV63_06110 [Ilumatobacteraceae bacterium]|nr:hypothetical protein [Ilumatobacteraceae bacterium]